MSTKSEVGKRNWQNLLQRRAIAAVLGKVEICRLKGALQISETWLMWERGYFGRGEMQKEFEEAAFGLQKGEMSGVIETASGVHLIER